MDAIKDVVQHLIRAILCADSSPFLPTFGVDHCQGSPSSPPEKGLTSFQVSVKTSPSEFQFPDSKGQFREPGSVGLQFQVHTSDNSVDLSNVPHFEPGPALDAEQYTYLRQVQNAYGIIEFSGSENLQIG